jgi:hypothetical protein
VISAKLKTRVGLQLEIYETWVKVTATSSDPEVSWL